MQQCCPATHRLSGTWTPCKRKWVGGQPQRADRKSFPAKRKGHVLSHMVCLFGSHCFSTHRAFRNQLRTSTKVPLYLELSMNKGKQGQLKLSYFNLPCYLIGINEYYFVHSQWEENIQEENFITPDDSLFFCLLMKPVGPFVLHKLIIKAIFFSHMRYKRLQNRQQDKVSYILIVPGTTNWSTSHEKCMYRILLIVFHAWIFI